jgi:hypothetical protein
MLDTIASLNKYADEADITEPSLMNFCITDGSSIVVTRYISSRKDEAASLVRAPTPTSGPYIDPRKLLVVLIWY